MDETIGSTIWRTIGYRIMDAIVPPPRHDGAGSGDTETKDEQGKRRGEREGAIGIPIPLYGCRGNVLDWKICIYRAFHRSYLRWIRIPWYIRFNRNIIWEHKERRETWT